MLFRFAFCSPDLGEMVLSVGNLLLSIIFSIFEHYFVPIILSQVLKLLFFFPQFAKVMGVEFTCAEAEED